MARGKITGNDRFGFGAFLVALAALFFVADQPRFGWFTALAIFVPYLTFVAPLRCAEPIRKDRSPCRKTGWGVLIGCDSHRLDKIRRVFGGSRAAAAAPPARARRRPADPLVAAQSVPVASAGRKLYEAAGLAAGVLGAIAGWLALFYPNGM